MNIDRPFQYHRIRHGVRHQLGARENLPRLADQLFQNAIFGGGEIRYSVAPGAVVRLLVSELGHEHFSRLKSLICGLSGIN